MVVTRRRECPSCDCCLDATEPATHGLDEEGVVVSNQRDSQLLLPVNVSLYSMDSVSSLALLQSASIPGRKRISGGGSSRPVSQSLSQSVSHSVQPVTQPRRARVGEGRKEEQTRPKTRNACGGLLSARRQVGVHGTEVGLDQEATKVEAEVVAGWVRLLLPEPEPEPVNRRCCVQKDITVSKPIPSSESSLILKQAPRPPWFSHRSLS